MAGSCFRLRTRPRLDLSTSISGAKTSKENLSFAREVLERVIKRMRALEMTNPVAVCNMAKQQSKYKHYTQQNQQANTTKVLTQWILRHSVAFKYVQLLEEQTIWVQCLHQVQACRVN